MVGTIGRGGGAVFPGPGSQGKGLRGPMLFLTLFQPAPYSPPHCPFQVGAPAPPPHPPPLLPRYSDAQTEDPGNND